MCANMASFIKVKAWVKLPTSDNRLLILMSAIAVPSWKSFIVFPTVIQVPSSAKTPVVIDRGSAILID